MEIVPGALLSGRAVVRRHVAILHPPPQPPPQEHGGSPGTSLGGCLPSLGQAAGKLHQQQIKTKSIYSATDHFVKNIAQHRTSNGGMWGRKAVSCVVKTYPKQV